MEVKRGVRSNPLEPPLPTGLIMMMIIIIIIIMIIIIIIIIIIATTTRKDEKETATTMFVSKQGLKLDYHCSY